MLQTEHSGHNFQQSYNSPDHPTVQIGTTWYVDTVFRSPSFVPDCKTPHVLKRNFKHTTSTQPRPTGRLEQRENTVQYTLPSITSLQLLPQ